MRPDFRASIAEGARACPFQLLTRRKNVFDLETEMVNRPARIFGQEFGYWRTLAGSCCWRPRGPSSLRRGRATAIFRHLLSIVSVDPKVRHLLRASLGAGHSRPRCGSRS